jgi:UDP-N-acetyl-D-mannosaminuronic acid dehydrogenase
MRRRSLLSFKVAVVGAAGHVGLPLALVLAEHGNDTVGIDVNEVAVNEINSGLMPFYEEGAESLLPRCLASGNFRMTTELAAVRSADVIVIVLGTPIDKYFNPYIDGLVKLINELCPLLGSGQQIVLRSTVSPGTTDHIKRVIESKTGMTEGVDFDLIYAPERVLQGKALTEIRSLPHLIGAYSEESFNRIGDFFSTFSHSFRHFLRPVEAELGKLITNMTRYVNFALANEYHMIADLYEANINKIIDACNDDYPRLNLPSPGPNVGGPCLSKDGWFLVEKVPFNDLIAASYRINEGIPSHIVSKLAQEEGIESVAILGMTFKADNDDLRDSVSFKLKKQLELHGYEVRCLDPHVQDYSEWSAIRGVDALILMTPHKEFGDLSEIADLVGNPGALVIDIWGFWEEMRHRSKNGYFSIKEVMRGAGFGDRLGRVFDATGDP